MSAFANNIWAQKMKSVKEKKSDSSNLPLSSSSHSLNEMQNVKKPPTLFSRSLLSLHLLLPVHEFDLLVVELVICLLQQQFQLLAIDATILVIIRGLKQKLKKTAQDEQI